MIAGWQMRKFKFMPKQPIWHPPIHVSMNPIPATAAIKEVGHRLREFRLFAHSDQGSEFTQPRRHVTTQLRTLSLAQ